MRKLFKEQKKTLYQISKENKLSLMTLYRYTQGIRKISDMSVHTLLGIANSEHIEANLLLKKMLEYERENKDEEEI